MKVMEADNIRYLKLFLKDVLQMVGILISKNLKGEVQ